MCRPARVRTGRSKARHTSCTSSVVQMLSGHCVSGTFCALHCSSANPHLYLFLSHLHYLKAIPPVYYQTQKRRSVWEVAGLCVYPPGIFVHPLCTVGHCTSAPAPLQMGLPQTEDPWCRPKESTSCSSGSMDLNGSRLFFRRGWTLKPRRPSRVRQSEGIDRQRLVWRI
jgi:hypothetical protein